MEVHKLPSTVHCFPLPLFYNAFRVLIIQSAPKAINRELYLNVRALSKENVLWDLLADPDVPFPHSCYVVFSF